VEKSGRKKYITRGMEEAPENNKESLRSVRASGMNEYVVPFSVLDYLQNGRIERTACLNHSLLQTGKMSCGNF
jgi:hypothetical protein